MLYGPRSMWTECGGNVDSLNKVYNVLHKNIGYTSYKHKVYFNFEKIGPGWHKI